MQRKEILRSQIVDNCTVCNGSGIFNNDNCECIIKFRTYNRMINGGFKSGLMDLVCSDGYVIPESDHPEILDFYHNNPVDVLKGGLSLYLFSSERGRGKTTLAHYLVYRIVSFLSVTTNYDRHRSYCFESAHALAEKKHEDSEDETWKSTVYVLDDLGNEDRSSKWKKEMFLSLLQKIIHHRRDNRLPIIITSNYNAARLSTLYEGVMDSLFEICPDGKIGGVVFRQVEIICPEDLRTNIDCSSWPSGL